jgi:hypothetical protein
MASAITELTAGDTAYMVRTAERGMELVTILRPEHTVAELAHTALMAALAPGRLTTRTQAAMHEAPQLRRRMEAGALGNPIIRAPAHIVQRGKAPIRIRNGEVPPYHAAAKQQLGATTRIREARLVRCRLRAAERPWALAARLEPEPWADQRVVISTRDETATYTSKAVEAGNNTTTEAGRTLMLPQALVDNVRKSCNSSEEPIALDRGQTQATAPDRGQTQVRCKV